MARRDRRAFRDADHDAVLALARWVEQGVAPEAIVATTLKDGAVARQRPVCVYPKQARYTGPATSTWRPTSVV